MAGLRGGAGKVRVSESRRIAAVQAPVIPTVGRWLRATPGTISFGQGMVSYGPPPQALEAARRFGGEAIDHRYGPVEGLPELADALESKLAAENGIRVRPESRLVISAGSNMSFMNAILAIVDTDDEVIIPAPFYFNHEMGVQIAGAKPVVVRTQANYQLDVDAIADAITPRTRAVVTVSPNNPTGVVFPEAALRAVNQLCADRGLFHIHDEAYEHFTYSGVRNFSPGSIAGAGAHTISMYSFSKGYGMASWRVGYMVAPERLWDAINKIQDTELVCPPAISQVAALAALKAGAEYPCAGLAKLDGLRRLIFAELGRPDVPCDTPDANGAFYFFTRVRTSLDSMTVAERLIREHKVAAMPGSAFGATDGCYLRISYGMLDEATAIEGLKRLTAGLQAVADR
jgi:aspartate/methionine/tyrosine aminotransferase